jgi:hypothetical protein
VAAVELQLGSSGDLLRVTLVELELDLVLQEEDGGRGGRISGTGRGGRRARKARRSATSSFLTPVDGGRRGVRRGRRAEDQNFGNQNLRLLSNVLDVFGFFCKKSK